MRRIARSATPALAVAGGGLVGSALRTLVAEALPAARGRLPLATLLVNLIGSGLLGFYLARRQRVVTARWSLQFWAIGALGSLTTFSAFSVEVVRLTQSGHSGLAVGYALGCTMGGLAVAVVGERVGEVT